jgi:hypothetical protein
MACKQANHTSINKITQHRQINTNKKKVIHTSQVHRKIQNKRKDIRMMSKVKKNVHRYGCM